MYLPFNGRIAIIDDQINQAKPLIQVLSRNQLPFTYFSGEVDFLPNETEAFNDIRVLFLDINLIDDRERTNKELKGSLVPVLKRVVSVKNYPYVIIYWSRHEHHKDLIENEIFGEVLKDRKPIAFLSASKADFFSFDGRPTEKFEDNIKKLFNTIQIEVAKNSVYGYLLEWENRIHISADKTLQEIFSGYHSYIDWSNNANFIMSKLGKAFLGKHYKSTTPEDQIRASFISFSSVFKDTLESQIYNGSIPNPKELNYDIDQVVCNVAVINEKLNFSKKVNDICESGNVIVFKDKDAMFGDLLNKLISFFQLVTKLTLEHKEASHVEIKKLADNEHKKIKKEVKKTWLEVGIVVTPVCDFVQKDNRVFDRVVKGVMIRSEYKKYLDDKSEAVYTLPVPVSYNNSEYIIVLDFRYFVTMNLKDGEYSGLFRVRQELLSEIQSRLSRHINRQGILFLDERY